ncbi:MAG: hypothetical protein LBE08_03765 [Bifidobacteriaceae bacterium]|nr:hypothetical protein [Bifidobacteriaceae bacterium]
MWLLIALGLVAVAVVVIFLATRDSGTSNTSAPTRNAGNTATAEATDRATGDETDSGQDPTDEEDPNNGQNSTVIPPEGYYDGGADGRAADATHYLRFFPDGTVLSITSMATRDELIAEGILDFGQEYCSQGIFVIVGDTIVFSTTSSSGTVDYSGTINPDGTLSLHSISQINGNESDRLFEPFS